MKISIKEIVSYKGHSIQANGNVNITFSAMYGELTNSIKILQLLNNDVTIIAKLAGSKPIKLGVFRVKNVAFDGDGESKIKLVSLFDSVEMDNITDIISQENFQIKLEADVDLENGEEGDSNDG